MEDLNKNQLILLALLVSFVTSIATGIATVSLLEQAPPRVTQVINRVVERTVETVTPQQNVVTKEETVVVREEDLVTESIEANNEKLVRIVGDNDVVLALGMVVRDSGLIATVPNLNPTRMQVRLPNGTTYAADIVSHPEENTVGFVQIEEELPEQLSPVTFTAIETIKLGQSVIAMAGQNETAVGLGVVSQFVTGTNEDGSTSVKNLNFNLSGQTLTQGSMVTNLFGEVIALYNGSSYVPFTVIRRALERLGT